MNTKKITVEISTNKRTFFVDLEVTDIKGIRILDSEYTEEYYILSSSRYKFGDGSTIKFNNEDKSKAILTQVTWVTRKSHGILTEGKTYEAEKTKIIYGRRI